MPKRAREDCDEARVLAAIVLSFDPSTQELGPLLEAAYCLMSQASCHIDSSRDRYLCRLVANSTDLTGDALRASFLDRVADANLRASVPAARTTVAEASGSPLLTQRR